MDCELVDASSTRFDPIVFYVGVILMALAQNQYCNDVARKKFTFLNVFPQEIQDLILLKTDIFSVLSFDASDYVLRELIENENLTVYRLKYFHSKCGHSSYTYTNPDEEGDSDENSDSDEDDGSNGLKYPFCCNCEKDKRVLTNRDIYQLLQWIRKFRKVNITHRDLHTAGAGNWFQFKRFPRPFNVMVIEIFQISEEDVEKLYNDSRSNSRIIFSNHVWMSGYGGMDPKFPVIL